LIFAGRDVLQGRSIFNRPDARISPVLPITQQNFNEMVARLQNTNMIVRQEPLNLVSQKLSDEGSSSPFWARLFLGILRLADIVFPDAAKREEFHKITELLILRLLPDLANAQRRASSPNWKLPGRSDEEMLLKSVC
jgi:hypothetical protein